MRIAHFIACSFGENYLNPGVNREHRDQFEDNWELACFLIRLFFR